MAKRIFGTLPDGQDIYICSMHIDSGLSVDVITYGAIIQSIRVPDKNGKLDDILLGKSDLEGYVSGAASAAYIGRVANRIGGASYTLGGETIKLQANEGENTLHGASGNYGIHNFTVIEATDTLVRLALRDKGEGGFPGEASVEIAYELTGDNTLVLSYTVIPTETTPVNVTNHAYFNLAGQGSGTIDNQYLQICSDFYTPADKKDIPTGEVLSVEDTPFDLRAGKRFSDALKDLSDFGDWHNGFDHNLILDGRGYRKTAIASDPVSGRTLTLYTDLPGVQLFTANFFSKAGFTGKDDVKYPDHAGFCLETQFFPDSINKPHFPCCIVQAGEVFTTRTGFQFTVNA